MTTIDEILSATQSLSVPQRVELMSALWEQIPPDEWPQPTADAVQETEHRSELIRRGEMSTAPWSEVRERARRAAGLDD